MAVITTYVCDVSGISSADKSEFVQVMLQASVFQKSIHHQGGYKHDHKPQVIRIVYKDVAVRLGLVNHNEFDIKAVEVPEITFEGKLKALLEDHVTDLVQGHLENVK